MTQIERLLDTRSLKTSRLVAAEQVQYMYYDEVSDILMLMFVSPEIETVAHYIDSYVALLYEPESLEVVGLQVENFEHSFMPRHESLATVWRLSDSGRELGDVRDLMLVFERKKQDVSRELKSITSELLARRGVPVPA